jgi:hypothetical protein
MKESAFRAEFGGALFEKKKERDKADSQPGRINANELRMNFASECIQIRLAMLYCAVLNSGQWIQ